MQAHPYAEARTRDAALAAAPYGMFICTADGTFDSVNAAFEKLTGFTIWAMIAIHAAGRGHRAQCRYYCRNSLRISLRNGAAIGLDSGLIHHYGALHLPRRSRTCPSIPLPSVCWS